MSLSITLPYPPSANRYWRHPSAGPLAGRHLISAEGRTYRTNVAAAVYEQRACQKLSGPLSVAVALCPPDHRRRDLDNTLKGLLDAMTHAGVWGDDSQIRRLLLEWDEVERGGRAFVRVEALEVVRG